MTRLIINNSLRFLFLILLQVLIANYVYLGGYVIPFVYLLAVLMLPTNYGKIPMLTTAFFAGLMVDMFCNIPGFHAFSCTMMAFFRILLGDRILTQNDPEEVVAEPSIGAVPFQTFSVYALLMALIYSITYGMLEAFSFGNFWMTLISMAINTVVAWAIILLSQFFVAHTKR